MLQLKGQDHDHFFQQCAARCLTHFWAWLSNGPEQSQPAKIVYIESHTCSLKVCNRIKSFEYKTPEIIHVHFFHLLRWGLYSGCLNVSLICSHLSNSSLLLGKGGGGGGGGHLWLDSWPDQAKANWRMIVYLKTDGFIWTSLILITEKGHLIYQGWVDRPDLSKTWAKPQK